MKSPEFESFSRLFEENLGRGETVEAVDGLIRAGIESHTSDIHILSRGDGLSILVRRDGMLHPVVECSDKQTELLFTRLKVLARMVTYQKRLPQDGSIDSAPYADGKPVDIRVSIAPTVEGERATIRFLYGSEGLIPLESLGWESEQLSRYKHLIEQGRGVVLLTGPCGSGKTTTIMASIRALQAERTLNICTVEDPVEYRLQGVSQVAIDPAGGLDFARAVRALLRHDPDVLGVGEIRDTETAAVVMDAGLLGHLVFSTIHGGSAAAVLVRLLDMGIAPGTLVAAIRAIVSQRLVRLLCPECKVESEHWPPQFAGRARPEGIKRFFIPQGCEECDRTGYKGRQGVFEVTLLSDSIQDAILKSGSIRELKKAAKVATICTLHGQGWRLVEQGLIDPIEMHRGIGEET